MTFTDGLHAALYVLGFLVPFLVIALLVALVLVVDIPHRIRVLKLRRETRRSGRT